MSFKERFDNGIIKFNKRLQSEPQLRDLLKEYEGRTIVLKVTDDAVYVFHLSVDGLRMTVSPENCPEDMYLETSKEILQKMIDQKRVNVIDLLTGKIKWRNISLKEVNVVKKVLGM
ncbi:SCP2 sterol-binding domain-containing protein [Candidatus Hecatella orcuttiae]|uniref:SCP2 sterol-binding domain-containing protein n=1 Tax=Candidatus Hecatella orcuttiae TaxID=1935119 RepID=UPI002867D208|nr:hypothetical protein [Candidatus Hecatella orcuttiae]